MSHSAEGEPPSFSIIHPKGGITINQTVAKIAVDKTTLNFDILFSYQIPDNMNKQLNVGQRVIVPFGAGNTPRQGIVLELCNEDVQNLKPVSKIIDKKPIINKEMAKLVPWIKERYFCTYYDAVNLVIPTGLNMRAEITYETGENLDTSVLTDDQREIYFKIAKSKTPVKSKNLFKKLGWSDEENELIKMIDLGFIKRNRDFARKTNDATLTMVKLTDDINDYTNIKLTPKQQQIIAILEEFPITSLKELLYYSGLTKTVVDGLEKKGIVECYDQQILRTPYTHIKQSAPQEIALNVEQQQAFEGLWSMINKKQAGAALLYGVTGSGKTQVFIKLIEQTINIGRQVIMLVPEIGLTPQAIRIFKNIFGDRVAVLHSGLSLGERLDEYKRIETGVADIVVGTRSAIFSPLNNIGLIIIDEEQEYTYKSERSPRYHARDVAKFRCAYHNALLLLASATPSIETYYNAVNKKYSIFKLNKRYSDTGLPPVYVIDMNDEKEVGNTSIISSPLAEAIDENLNCGEQTILLLNRRGFNTVVNCSTCGEIVVCPNCSIPYTYHKANNKLVCHYCGNIEDMPKTCKRCTGSSLRFLGLGTQKAETQLKEIFPTARILRMDMDTTMSKFSHEKMLEAFRQGEYDIMIGTQMVAKGLDFENVTLVGVLLADQALYANDFRSSERAFSMLTQVVGRCGRGEVEGRAYIQTYTPFNEIITMAASQNYDDFYKSEICVRKVMLYPPFTSFCVIGFVGKFDNTVKKGSVKFLEILKSFVENMEKRIPLRVLGPSEASVLKVAGKYRYKIIIKCIDNMETRKTLENIRKKFQKAPESRGINVFIDMNYYGSM